MKEICKGCGRCCKKWILSDGKYKTKEGIILEFIDGKCQYLTDDNECAIEDSKPSVCKDYFCE